MFPVQIAKIENIVGKYKQFELAGMNSIPISKKLFNLEMVKNRLRRIWSQTHLIPGLPVPDTLSPWTNNPHKIDPPRQMVPNKFGPYGQMVPKNLAPLDKLSPANSVPVFLDPYSLSSWTNGNFWRPYV